MASETRLATVLCASSLEKTDATPPPSVFGVGGTPISADFAGEITTGLLGRANMDTGNGYTHHSVAGSRI